MIHLRALLLVVMLLAASVLATSTFLSEATNVATAVGGTTTQP